MLSASLPTNRVLLAAVGLLLARPACSSRSLPDIPHIATYFGTKTRYEEVNPQLLRDVSSLNASVLMAPDSERCSPVHLTAVIRHGSRYPTAKNIRRIQRLSELVRGEASRGPGSEDWLRDIQSRWEMWYTEDMDGQLVLKGRDELRQLAGRLAAMFPSLLSLEHLTKRRVRFTTSSKHRCVSSVEAVQDGLMEHWGHAHSADLVEAAFFLCSYELSIKSLYSPWCFLFDENDAKVLEYKSDLKQYWKRSHGHVISGLSSCPLFHHIFRTLDRAGRPRRSSEASPEPASILLGHAETLLPLLSLLGLYKDQTPPTANNYQSQHGRSFRTSRIVPYAANLLFVLYDCQRGPRVQLLINESPVRFPGLESEVAPLYRDVRATYRHLLDGCDFHRECEGRGGGRGPNTEL
ncbi:multiple inositol polyphosphate phosphatase 1b isoform X2 [Platichthys flesus]|uniref:multiple inositol polyphosphate phosphatase 1b isoform X2 n=1 Tax=Platichthys flesus TaxID=8260 RepID=UPI002DBA50AF|nr:multiple inositol polyphosphate phosphatase 1b isoform X2 [Platichthys flesus]